jgi:DNA-dependent protein kinase catalytic subunit
MNKIFKEDPVCLNRDLNLKTFNVVPITNRLGSIEWYDNTEPLKGLINREHKRVEQGRDISNARAITAIRKWLQGLPGNE